MTVEKYEELKPTLEFFTPKIKEKRKRRVGRKKQEKNSEPTQNKKLVKTNVQKDEEMSVAIENEESDYKDHESKNEDIEMTENQTNSQVLSEKVHFYSKASQKLEILKEMFPDTPNQLAPLNLDDDEALFKEWRHYDLRVPPKKVNGKVKVDPYNSHVSYMNFSSHPTANRDVKYHRKPLYQEDRTTNKGCYNLLFKYYAYHKLLGYNTCYCETCIQLESKFMIKPNI